MNLAESRVFLRGEPVEFTGAEYRLLCLLLKNSGRVLTQGTVLDKLWDGAGNFVDDNTLSMCAASGKSWKKIPPGLST